MAKDVIGALRVTLGFDTSQFEHGAAKAKATARRDMGEIKASISGARSAIAGLATAFVGVEAVQAAKRALDYAAGIKSIAAEAGVTRRELQEYRYVGSQVSLTQQEMDGSLKNLTKTIGEAKAGSKEQATIFRDLGVAVEDANGRVYSTGEVIPRLADALSRVKDPATRARLEVKLFGESGQKLDALLTQGSKGIELMRKRADELGLVLGDDLTDSADRANKNLSEIKQTLNAQFASAIAQNADAISGLAGALGKVSSNAIVLIGQYPRLSAALAGIAVGSRFGPVGAAAGGFGGALLGDEISATADDQNMNLKHRTKRLKESLAQMRSLQKRTNQSDASGYLGFRRAGEREEGGTTLDTAIQEVARQTKLLEQATAYAKTQGQAPSVVPDGALPVPNAGRTRKGPKDRTEQLAQRYRDELAGLYDDRLGLEQDITADIREQARLEHERINNKEAAYAEDLKSRVKQGELTQAQADQLKLVSDRNFELEHTRVNWKLDDEIVRDQLEVDQETLDRQRTTLEAKAAIATTAKEQRAAQLALLDNELESVRLSAQAVLDRHDASETDKAIAQAKKDQLASLREQGTLQINRQTMGPLESYFDSIPDTAAEINEAYENIAVNGIKSFNDGLATAAARTFKLKGLAGELFNQLIADVIRFNLAQATGGGGLLGGLFKLGGSLLGLGGASSLGKAIDIGGLRDMASAEAAAAGINFAGGGDMRILGRQGIDRNVLSLNGLPIANVSYGEKLSIANDNGAGGRAGAFYFDLRGAVMTQDLLNQMNAIGQGAAVAGSNAGSTGAQVAIARRQSRIIP